MNPDFLDQSALELALAPEPRRADLAQRLRDEAERHGVYPASIQPVYCALAAGDLPPLTVPAFNLRGLTYEIARLVWRTALDLEAGPVIFELAPPEASACDQTFEEYAAMVCAAACREGYRGPVFLQGDHFSLGSEDEIPGLLELAERIVAAGYYQIDIDGSHLFDVQAEDLSAYHAPNARATAQLVAALRRQKPDLALGGEVGEIGGRDTSLEDLDAFQSAFQRFLPPNVPGLDKVSAQTGTTHSGIVLPDGSTGRMEMDFELVASLGSRARELGWNGLVQHGASTLGFEALSRLPTSGVIEVHLATQFQNILFDHPKFPADLRDEMQRRLTLSDTGAEGDQIQQDPTLSPAQVFYQARWAAWGVFKRELWQLPRATFAPIGLDIQAWVASIFKSLRVANNAEILDRYYERRAG
jgi:fructose/tagatose bisphosphate aldolase